MPRYEEELVGPTEEEDWERYGEEKKELDKLYQDWEKPAVRVREASGQVIYWHITPYGRLRPILKGGLRPGGPKAMGFDVEVTGNKVFLGEDPADCYAQLAFADSDEVRHWALIKLDMSDYPHTIFFDESGFPYTTHPVSPGRILDYWKYDLAGYKAVGRGMPERFGPFKEMV